jgi:thimet oligopeptidase
LLGRVYLDLHPRAGKFGHAAQFELAAGIAGRQLPEGALVCNLPTGHMDHDDVIVLFHEFGHVIHHIVGGRQRWLEFSGVATEFDFIEAPSQLLEEWAWDPGVLQSFAVNDAGTPIPTELVARMRAAADFGRGSFTARQTFFAAACYQLHLVTTDDLTDLVRKLQEQYDVLEPIDGTHLHAGFSHLVQYTSAYYSYLWSLVIAKDLFSAFDGAHLFDAEIAGRYRDCVLAPGGSRDAVTLVEDFLGRPYSLEPFRRWLSEGAR